MTQTAEGRAAYLQLFPKSVQRTEALKLAHEIRRFEIELYWKRATYFWTILAVAFAGFFACDNANNEFGANVVASLGLILGTAWYVVNRGGNAWHHNWEQHVDLLEDEVTGPLYKTLINRKKYRFWKLTGPYPFSPSRANALVSLFVVFAWLILLGKSFVELVLNDGSSQFDAIAAACLMAVSLAGVPVLLRLRGVRQQGLDFVHATTREYAD